MLAETAPRTRYTVHLRVLSWTERRLADVLQPRKAGRAANKRPERREERPPLPPPGAPATHRHGGHVPLLSGALPLVHLEVSEDVEERLLPHWGTRGHEVPGPPQVQGGPGRACALPSGDGQRGARTGLRASLSTNPCAAAPALGPQTPAPVRTPLPRDMAPQLALPASADAHRTQGTQRVPSNRSPATAPLTPHGRRYVTAPDT